MAKKKPVEKSSPMKGRIAGRPEVKSLFDRLVELCGNDHRDAVAKLIMKSGVDGRTVKKIYLPEPGKERWNAVTDETILLELRELIQQMEATTPKPKRTGDRIVEYHGAPISLKRWVTRDDSTSKLLNGMWEGGNTRIVQLIADGGEGKSTLVRMWLEGVEQSGPPQVGRVFWWNFYCNRQVDAFFAALLRFLPPCAEEGPATRLAAEQVKRIVDRLNRDACVVVLDGFEEMLDSQQYDRLSPVRARELTALLMDHCRKNTKSMLIVTSRVSVAELEKERTAFKHQLSPLSIPVGRELLIRLGVKGETQDLEDVVGKCNGHALTLSLLGTYLVRYHGGESSVFPQLDFPGVKASHKERVARLLSLHNDQPRANRQNRGLLALFSTFRKPVKKAFAVALFNQAIDVLELTTLVAVKSQQRRFDDLLQELAEDHLLSEAQDGELLLHDLIRDYYSDRLAEYSQKIHVAWHKLVRDGYLQTEAATEPTDPSQLEPFVEAVHHSCKANEHDLAWKVALERVSHGKRFLSTLGMGQWRSALALMSDFFPQKDQRPDLKRLPLLSDQGHQAYLLALFGYTNFTLGRAEVGTALMERGANLAAIHYTPGITAFNFCALAEGYMLQGNLHLAGLVARHATELATSQNDADGMKRSWIYQAWIKYMRGDREGMGNVLQDGQKQFSDFPSVDDVHGTGLMVRGLHLYWMENIKEARDFLARSAEECERGQYFHQASRCRRILGEKAGKRKESKSLLIKAVELAKRAAFQPSLLEALAALGRWYVENREYDLAELHIAEAMELASRDGLNLHYIDSRINHARLLRSKGDRAHAQEVMDQANRESELFGYHWGLCVD